MIEHHHTPTATGVVSDVFDEEKWNLSRWYALYTRSRHEKIVSQELSEKQIQTFLPLRKFNRRWSDRFKSVEEPLFKGYLFVRTPLKERLSILKTRGVVRFVGPSANPVEVPGKDLETIKRLVAEEFYIDPFPYLKEGQRVYVRSGALKGTEGFIVRKDRHCRLVISVDALMQSISVAVDQAVVEPV